MHPPEFRLQHRLSDWPDCSLELNCCGGRVLIFPVRLLRARCGDPTFGEVIRRLKCGQCGGKPAPVYLVAGHHRRFLGGPPAVWAIELVPEPTKPHLHPVRGARCDG